MILLRIVFSWLIYSDLAGNRVGDDGAKAFAENLAKNSTLTSLDISSSISLSPTIVCVLHPL